MTRSEKRQYRTQGRSPHHFGALAVLAAALAVAGQSLLPVPAIAQDAPGHKPPSAGSAPNNTPPAMPGAGQQPGGGEGDSEPGDPAQGDAQEPDFSPGCPFRDRPLNLLV